MFGPFLCHRLQDLQADTADECLETLDGDCALHTLQIAAKYQPGLEMGQKLGDENVI